MSTSLLYHGFGIVGSHYVRQRFQEGQVTFRIRQARERLRCPQCDGDDVWVRGHEQRTFRMVPIGSKPTFLTLDVARVCCPVCDGVRQVKIGFADPKKRYTRSFERYALELSRQRDEQQDPTDEASSRWLPQSSVLQTENPGHPRAY
jgi:transposase